MPDSHQEVLVFWGQEMEVLDLDCVDGFVDAVVGIPVELKCLGVNRLVIWGNCAWAARALGLEEFGDSYAGAAGSIGLLGRWEKSGASFGCFGNRFAKSTAHCDCDE